MRLRRLILGAVLLSLALAPLASAQTPAKVYVQRSGDNPMIVSGDIIGTPIGPTTRLKPER